MLVYMDSHSQTHSRSHSKMHTHRCRHRTRTRTHAYTHTHTWDPLRQVTHTTGEAAGVYDDRQSSQLSRPMILVIRRFTLAFGGTRYSLVNIAYIIFFHCVFLSFIFLFHLFLLLHSLCLFLKGCEEQLNSRCSAEMALMNVANFIVYLFLYVVCLLLEGRYF